MIDIDFLPETEEFNSGNRDVILIDQSELNDITRRYSSLVYLNIPNTNAVLVLANFGDVNWFKRLQEYNSLDFALGIVLGYPRKVVEWFDNASDDELYNTGSVNFGSLKFKCPDNLFEYAYNELMNNIEISGNINHAPLLYMKSNHDNEGNGDIELVPLLAKIKRLKEEKPMNDENQDSQPLREVRIGSQKYTKVCSCNETSFGVPRLYSVIKSGIETETLAVIPFQDGPVKENGINGVANEDLIAIVIDRLEHFQKGEFANIYNDLAIDGLNISLKALRARTDERIKRGVEGTSEN